MGHVMGFGIKNAIAIHRKCARIQDDENASKGVKRLF
jgi:hypothetical protein